MFRWRLTFECLKEQLMFCELFGGGLPSCDRRCTCPRRDAIRRTDSTGWSAIRFPWWHSHLRVTDLSDQFIDYLYNLHRVSTTTVSIPSRESQHWAFVFHRHFDSTLCSPQPMREVTDVLHKKICLRAECFCCSNWLSMERCGNFTADTEKRSAMATMPFPPSPLQQLLAQGPLTGRVDCAVREHNKHPLMMASQLRMPPSQPHWRHQTTPSHKDERANLRNDAMAAQWRTISGRMSLARISSTNLHTEFYYIITFFIIF